MRAKSGFTLVEILIVVVILGILAAIVIPQFTEASTEAKESRLASDLQMLRSQVELFKVQHGDLIPGQSTSVTGTPSSTQFESGLTDRTEADGDAYDSENSTTGPYGPYMESVPTNPFVSGTTSFTFGADSSGCPSDGTSHWYYNTDTGTVYDNRLVSTED